MLRKCRFLFSTAEDPKWMKFFQGPTGLQVNTDRSLKNDASESLNLYIRQNYRAFTPEQVLQAFTKKDLNYETHKILELEFTERIIGDQKLSNESVITYFNRETMTLPNNQLIAAALLLEGTAIFDQMTLFQQTNYMQLAIRVGAITMPIYKKFLKNLKIEEEYLTSLTFSHYKSLIKLFDITSTSPYNLGLQEGFIDVLINKYVQKLNNNEILARELHKQDFQNIVLSFKPSILTSDQLSDIKISYAKILEKLVTKDYNFLFSKAVTAKEVLSKIYWLYEPNEYHLLSKSLPVLLNGKPDKSESIMGQILKHFKLFAPNFYYSQMKTCQKQYSNSYNYRIDLRSINFLLTANGLTALQSIMKDPVEVNDTLTTVLRVLTSIINSSKDDDLLSFDEIFSAKMESDGNQDFNESDFQDLANTAASQALAKTKDSIPQVIMRDFFERVEGKWENITQEFMKQGFTRFFISKSSKKVYCLESIFIYLEALSYLSYLQPEIRVNTKIFQNAKFLQLLQNLVYMPNFLEQVVTIKRTWPKLFSKEIDAYITQTKQEIDSFYNTAKSPQEFIDNVENNIKSSEIDQFLLGKYTERQSIALIQSFNFAKQKPHQIISKDLKNPFQEYTLTETYSKTLRNKLLFVTFRGDIIVQHTHLKELIWQALLLDNQKWAMNYSDFPYLVDFICEKQKIVVFLEEYPRLIKGLGKVHTYETDRAADYYKKKDYSVYFLDHKSYHPNPQEMLNILKQQFVYRYI